MKLTDLRGILQYIPQFREKTFIIAVDGIIVPDENFANILLDIAVLRSLNIRVVLVHGASVQIKALAEKHGIHASNLDGTGVTDAATLQLAMDAANRLTHEILEGLSANDLRAAYTNAIIAHPFGIIQGVDHLFTGKVERVDVELLQTLMNQSIIPVVPPLGFDGDGKTYRVNSDGIALAIAESLKATKLIFITAHEGLRCNGGVIRQMLVADLQELLRTGKVTVDNLAERLKVSSFFSTYFLLIWFKASNDQPDADVVLRTDAKALDWVSFLLKEKAARLTQA